MKILELVMNSVDVNFHLFSFEKVFVAKTTTIVLDLFMNSFDVDFDVVSI